MTSTRILSTNQTSRGMIIMASAMLIVPGMDAFAKVLGEYMSALQVVWGRMLFQTVFLVPILFIWGGGIKALNTKHPALHFLRGILMLGATTFFFMALKYLPIADAISIFFIEPMLLTLLSVLILKETIGWRRIMAIFVGFLGALIVIRPSFEEVGWPALLPLLTALCFSLYLLLTRKLSDDMTPVATQIYSGFAGFLGASILIGFLSQAGFTSLEFIYPDSYQWTLLLCLGLISTVSHLMIVIAFQKAPASVLAPFQYLEIISATLLGYLIFDDFPDHLTWVGIAIIIGSGLYIFWREQQVQARSQALTTSNETRDIKR